MNAEVVATIICGLLIAVGVVGTVLPVLPGSLLIALSLLAWALVVSSPAGWTVFGLGVAAVAVGMSAGLVLTGRGLKRRQIPNRSVLVGIIAAVVGVFVLPVVGLFVGFALGLFLAELVRLRDPAQAWASSWAALKATGAGILVECGCACLAAGIFTVGVWLNFAF